MKKTAFALVLAALALSMTFAPAASAKPAKPQTGIMKGQAAPDFSLNDMSGKKVSLSSLKNKVICLQFWATWCPYCIREMPRFKELHAKYSKKGLKIIGINIGANDPLVRVKAYQIKSQLPWPVLYDAAQKVSRQFMVTGIPVSIIIDRKGIIQHRGYQLPNNIDQIISQLL